jgi:hypothetical protein
MQHPEHIQRRHDPEILTTRKNLRPLMDVPEKWIDRAGQRRAFDKLILDVDSSASENHGRRERLRVARPGQSTHEFNVRRGRVRSSEWLARPELFALMNSKELFLKLHTDTSAGVMFRYWING